MGRFSAQISQLQAMLSLKEDIIKSQQADIAHLQRTLVEVGGRVKNFEEDEESAVRLNARHEELQDLYYATLKQFEECQVSRPHLTLSPSTSLQQEQLEQVTAQAELDKEDAKLELDALRFDHPHRHRHKLRHS